MSFKLKSELPIIYCSLSESLRPRGDKTNISYLKRLSYTHNMTPEILEACLCKLKEVVTVKSYENIYNVSADREKAVYKSLSSGLGYVISGDEVRFLEPKDIGSKLLRLDFNIEEVKCYALGRVLNKSKAHKVAITELILNKD